MTRDEATEYLIDISYKFGNISVEYLTEKDGEKMREAINVLTNEQQACDDAVNRAHVMLIVREFLNNSTYDEEMLVNDLNKLPSVQPKPTVCEDAVSREAVLNALGGPSKVADDNFDKMRERIRIINIINNLPSVNPQPKTGHWIVHPKGIYAHLICDNCLSNALYDCRTNYCPDCGVKMVEPQERSGEE